MFSLVGFGKGVLAITAELEHVLGGKLLSGEFQTIIQIASTYFHQTLPNLLYHSAGILSVPFDAQKYQQISNKSIKVIEGAAGNLPDKNSMQAAKEIKAKVLSLTDDDILLVLITGGGSALLSLPIEPITLDEKSALIKQLSRAGATITELNTVRILISQVKGGKLAEMGKNAHRIISLVISDIVNDPLDLIASGPTVKFENSLNSPREILEKYNLMSTLSASIAKVIQANEENQDIPETIKNSDVFLIGNNRMAIEAAMIKAKSFDLIPIFLSSKVQGNVVDVSQAFFELAVAVKNFSKRDEFFEKIAGISTILSAQSNFANDLVAALEAKPSSGICIISGGETTVTVTGDGLGGRNQELVLRFTKLCHDANTSSLNDLLLLSAGTDGIDGNNLAAGALGGSRILSNFIENVNDDVSQIMQDFIFRNDSYRFYKNVLRDYAGDRYQIITGHTGTNVMDVHLLMIMPNTEN